jgi:hypothetical protein
VSRYRHRGRGPRPAGPPSRTHHFQAVAGLVLLVTLAAGLPSVQAAQQTLKDDAGRVIYSIDDDGTVTMYEKSTGDQTISMATGTREQMQPQVTEISPDKISSGSFTILKIRGRNLVGATVKFSVPGIEVNPYMARPDSLDLPIRVPTTVPGGDVVVELTTPIGSTKTSFKLSDMQFGGFGSSRKEKQTFTTSAPSSCPEGMIGVSYELGGFCIEVDRTITGGFRKAERACGAKGRRLCQAPEWQQACEQTKAGKLAVKNMSDEWEWSSSWESMDSPVNESIPLQAIVVGKTDCAAKQAISSENVHSMQGRCCK